MKVDHSDRLGPVAFFPAAYLNYMHVECVLCTVLFMIVLCMLRFYASCDSFVDSVW